MLFHDNHIASKPSQLPLGVLPRLGLGGRRRPSSSGSSPGQMRRQRSHAQARMIGQLVRTGRAPAARAPRRARRPPAWRRSARRWPPPCARAVRQHQQAHGLGLAPAPAAPGSRCQSASDRPVLSSTSSARTMRCGSVGIRRAAISGSRAAQQGVQLRRRPRCGLRAPVGAHARDRSPAPATGPPAAP